jgi:hypothetical protein
MITISCSHNFSFPENFTHCAFSLFLVTLLRFFCIEMMKRIQERKVRMRQLHAEDHLLARDLSNVANVLARLAGRRILEIT